MAAGSSRADKKKGGTRAEQSHGLPRGRHSWFRPFNNERLNKFITVSPRGSSGRPKRIPTPPLGFALGGKVIGSPRQHYVLDVYHQPPGYSQPMVKEQHRIMGRSDAEAIREAQAVFGG